MGIDEKRYFYVMITNVPRDVCKVYRDLLANGAKQAVELITYL